MIDACNIVCTKIFSAKIHFWLLNLRSIKMQYTLKTVFRKKSLDSWRGSCLKKTLKMFNLELCYYLSLFYFWEKLSWLSVPVPLILSVKYQVRLWHILSFPQVSICGGNAVTKQEIGLPNSLIYWGQQCITCSLRILSNIILPSAPFSIDMAAFIRLYVTIFAMQSVRDVLSNVLRKLFIILLTSCLFGPSIIPCFSPSYDI